MSDMEFETSRTHLPLLQPGKRYRGVHGGRGSGKSHFFPALMLRYYMEIPGLRSLAGIMAFTGSSHSASRPEWLRLPRKLIAEPRFAVGKSLL